MQEHPAGGSDRPGYASACPPGTCSTTRKHSVQASCGERCSDSTQQSNLLDSPPPPVLLLHANRFRQSSRIKHIQPALHDDLLDLERVNPPPPPAPPAPLLDTSWGPAAGAARANAAAAAPESEPPSAQSRAKARALLLGCCGSSSWKGASRREGDADLFLSRNMGNMCKKGHSSCAWIVLACCDASQTCIASGMWRSANRKVMASTYPWPRYIAGAVLKSQPGPRAPWLAHMLLHSGVPGGRSLQSAAGRRRALALHSAQNHHTCASNRTHTHTHTHRQAKPALLCRKKWHVAHHNRYNSSVFVLLHCVRMTKCNERSLKNPCWA